MKFSTKRNRVCDLSPLFASVQKPMFTINVLRLNFYIRTNFERVRLIQKIKKYQKVQTLDQSIIKKNIFKKSNPVT